MTITLQESTQFLSYIYGSSLETRISLIKSVTSARCIHLVIHQSTGISMNQFQLQLRLFLLVLTVCSVSAFSSGAAIVNGQVLMSRLYCGRQPLHRAPFHLNMTRCGGYCHASLATDDKFRIDLSDNVYWDSVINGKPTHTYKHTHARARALTYRCVLNAVQQFKNKSYCF